MKNNILFKVFCLSFLTATLSGCNSDFLNTAPATEFSETAVWGDPALVETYINNLYDRIDEPLTDGRMKAMIVDEAHYRGNTSSTNFNNGLITQDNIPAWSGVSDYFTWDELYKSIRYCNKFFDNVDKISFPITPVDGKTLQDRMMGEVHFLRATFYFNLTRIYGGVPIIKNVYGLNDDFSIARNSYADCISFIISDLDKAIELLPLQHTGNNLGRATKGAAMAMKSRVLLYAASDLYNKQVYDNYANQELIRYTDNNQKNRWRAAKDAAKAVIDLGIYSLYKPNPTSSSEASDNYYNLFISKDCVEDIFVKYFTVNVGQRYGLYTSPNGYRGWGANAPIGNFVDDYEMSDGTAFDWNNPEHAASPYANREPRFYATIFYNGAPWRPRYDEAKGLDPENRIQTGRKEVWNSKTSSVELHYGVDTRTSPIENWNGSETGYYTKKYLDPNIDAVFVRQAVTWRFIRYGEILLNYAEACIELGEEEEARTFINMIRKRAGLPPITETGEALKERYRHERRIELGMEDHRFFDVRRWLIGERAYKPALKADIIYKLNDDKTTSKTPTIRHKVFENRKWENKMYFMPIMRSELNKNDKLIQNPEY